MRAAILTEYGAPPAVGEFEDPVAGEGQMVVDVLAGGLNPVDLRLATGTFYGGSSPLPSVVGFEGVGRSSEGGRVYFNGCVAPYGAFAERTLIDAGAAIPVGDDVDPGLVIACGIAGRAAWLALEWRAQLREGETVLVLGASGPVGQMAVQAARLLGAGRVVAAARSAEGLERARALGADATVQIGAVEDLAAAFREAGEGRIDVIVDPLWGEPAAAAVEAASRGARLVQLGESAGERASISSAAVRGKLLSILGHTNLLVAPEIQRDAFIRLLEHAAAGELTAEVERVRLDDLADAWERQAGSPGRKLVIVP